ncbi:MAG: PAS domain S-box protein [Desulfovibrionaceae bacterium]
MPTFENAILRFIADETPMGIVALSRNFEVLYINEAACRMFATSPREIVGRPWLQAIPPERRHEPEQFLAVVDHGERIRQFETERLRRDGTRFWVELSVGPLTLSDGKGIGLSVICQDITRRKRAEQDLDRFRLAVEHSLDGILMCDLSGNVQYANPAWARMHGYAPFQLEGCHMRLFAEPCRPEDDLASPLAHLLNLGRFEGETLHRRRDGVIFPVRLTASVVRSETGDPLGFVSVARDISVRKRAEALREDVERMVRHDLKSPLNGIYGLAQLLLMDPQLTPMQREQVDLIHQGAVRMVNLIGRSMGISRMEQGLYQPRLAPVNLAGLLGTLIRQLEPVARQGGVVFAPPPEPDGGESVVMAEKALVQTMFGNLLTNAVEASRSGQQVAVTLSRVGEGVLVDIHNAALVPADVRERFFDKYATSGKPAGTGLGTYSARLVARAHGGEITFTSEPSEGTHVTVVLPRRSGAARGASPEERRAHERRAVSGAVVELRARTGLFQARLADVSSVGLGLRGVLEDLHPGMTATVRVLRRDAVEVPELPVWVAWVDDARAGCRLAGDGAMPGVLLDGDDPGDAAGSA